MKTVHVKLYKGNERLVVPATFADEPKTEPKDKYVKNKFDYQEILNMGTTTRLPTPAELSHLRQELYRDGNGNKWEQSAPYWTSHGIGKSDKESIFGGKPIVGLIKSVDLVRKIAEPDYERAVAPDPKLYRQGSGFIQRWEVIGEYALEDGAKNYFSMPIIGNKDQELVWTSLKWFVKEQFLPLTVGGFVHSHPRNISTYTPSTYLSFFEVIKTDNIQKESFSPPDLTQKRETSPNPAQEGVDDLDIRVINALKSGKLKIATRDGRVIFDNYDTSSLIKHKII